MEEEYKKNFKKYNFLKEYSLRNFIWIIILITIFSASYIHEAPAFLFEWQTQLSDLLLQEREPAGQIQLDHVSNMIQNLNI